MIRILLLGLVLAGVYYLYRMVTQQNAGGAAPVTPANDPTAVEAPSEAPSEAGEAAGPPPPQASSEASSGASSGASSEAPLPSEQAEALEEAARAEAQEMMECPVCGAYVPETARDGCGRPDCPIPAIADERAAEGKG